MYAIHLALILALLQATGSPGMSDLDVPYGPGGDKQMLDLYLPEKKPFATVVFIYGGGWHAGSRKGVTPIGQMLQKEGLGSALISHRLNPPDKFPAMIEDAAAAFAWVKRHIGERGGDPNRVFLVGHSSGAHLALLLATDPKWLATHKLATGDIAGVVGLSTPVDLEPHAGKMQFANILMMGRGADAFGRDGAVMKAASPIQHVSKALPPLLLVAGDGDFPGLEEDGKLFVQKAKAAGASTEFLLANGCGHMDVVASLLKEKHPVRDQVLLFLNRTGK